MRIKKFTTPSGEVVYLNLDRACVLRPLPQRPDEQGLIGTTIFLEVSYLNGLVSVDVSMPVDEVAALFSTH